MFVILIVSIIVSIILFVKQCLTLVKQVNSVDYSVDLLMINGQRGLSQRKYLCITAKLAAGYQGARSLPDCRHGGALIQRERLVLNSRFWPKGVI